LDNNRNIPQAVTDVFICVLHWNECCSFSQNLQDMFVLQLKLSFM